MSKMGKLVSRLRGEGPRRTISYLVLRSASSYGRLVAWWAERRLGISVRRNVDLPEVGITGRPECHRYEPTDVVTFRKFIKLARVVPGRDVFLDVGSGLGWAVIMAGWYPFRRVIGVELSSVLSAMAAENLRRVKQRLVCHNVELVTADATGYQIPRDVTHIYMYNPFSGQVLRRVLENIRVSVAQYPRRCVLMLKNTTPFEHEIGSCDWLYKTHEFRSWSIDAKKCMIFEVRV